MAREALAVAPVPDDVSLDRVTRPFESAGPGPCPPRYPAPIAVSFQTHVNAFGVQQQRCVLCGNCISGNYSAKNTLIMNYLPGAAAAGAEIYCGVAVQTVEPGPDHTWLVRVPTLDWPSGLYGRPELTIRADAVLLASGTLGSTEILLRSRDRRGSGPVSSARKSLLGQRRCDRIRLQRAGHSPRRWSPCSTRYSFARRPCGTASRTRPVDRRTPPPLPSPAAGSGTRVR